MYVNFIEELDKSSATAKQKEDIKKILKTGGFHMLEIVVSMD